MNRFAYANISLQALENNYNGIRKLVGETCKIMAIVKANAYGHGAVEVARHLDKCGADYFALATLDEVLELRTAGITKPMLILGYVPYDGYADAVKNDVSLTIYSKEDAIKLNHVAKSLGKVVKVHIKVNTGMNRIGLSPDENGLEIVKFIDSLSNIYVEGIFSHFAASDCKDKSWAKNQFDLFMSFDNLLSENSITIPIKHMANSAAIMEMPEAYLDMVRPGIILYGEYPSHEVDRSKLVLKNVMTFIGKIVQIRQVPRGTAIGYGGTGVTTGDSLIATVPIGYEDGYFRLLSNKVSVLAAGKRLPQIGNICMDQFMVDITDCPSLSVGDEVVLYGASGDERITLEDIADIVGTINYEIATSLSNRVIRQYI